MAMNFMVITLKLNPHVNGTLQLASTVDDKDTGPATVLMTTGVIVVIAVVSAVTYRLGVVIPHVVLIPQVVVAVEALRHHDLDLVLVIDLVADGVLVHQDLVHDPGLVVVEVAVVHASGLVLALALALVKIQAILAQPLLAQPLVVPSHLAVLQAPRTKHLVLDQLPPPGQLNPRVVIVRVRAVARPVKVVKVKEVVAPAVVRLKAPILKVKITAVKVRVVMVIVVRVKM